MNLDHFIINSLPLIWLVKNKRTKLCKLADQHDWRTVFQARSTPFWESWKITEIWTPKFLIKEDSRIKIYKSSFFLIRRWVLSFPLVSWFGLMAFFLRAEFEEISTTWCKPRWPKMAAWKSSHKRTCYSVPLVQYQLRMANGEPATIESVNARFFPLLGAFFLSKIRFI